MRVNQGWFFLFFLMITCLVKSEIYCQASAVYTDPAQGYLKFILDNQNSATTFTRVGTYKVQGTSYLFGGGQNGNIFSREGQALDVKMNYNTFNQQLEIVQADRKILTEEAKDVDSFFININTGMFSGNLYFVNASLYKQSNNFFLQRVVQAGNKFLLFKKYQSGLTYVSTNYMQSDLRQFDLNYEYYYTDAAQGTLKKIKPNLSALKKEFKDRLDFTSLPQEISTETNQEKLLVAIFDMLNK